MRLLRLIGILCLSICMAYWHPCKTEIDWIMMLLFWFGLNFFVDSERRD